jgi:hypothetical protein
MYLFVKHIQRLYNVLPTAPIRFKSATMLEFFEISVNFEISVSFSKKRFTRKSEIPFKLAQPDPVLLRFRGPSGTL